MLVDSHCHLFKEYYDDMDVIINRAKENGVGMIISNGCDDSSNREVLDIIKKYDIVYGAIGIQPEEVNNVDDDSISFIEEHINDDKIVAIGEIGLDHHYEGDYKRQEYIFKKQLEIAAKYNKPVIVHSRDCIKETYNILKEYNVKGILHCYSGSLEMAREFIKLGFLIGIGGVSTFNNAKKLVSVIKNIDLSYIVLETDSPYLAPVPYRGSRNEPANVKLIADKISEIKGIDFKEVSDVTTKNFLHLFDK